MEGSGTSRRFELVLLHEVSSGTFARLYLAQAIAPGGLERLVAVKIVREQWGESEEVITRTRDEAKLLARLRHRNILRVEELTEIDGHLAILMEYVDGLDLKQLVEGLAAKGGRIPARAALRIVAEAASAIDAAYNKVPFGMDRPLQVVHRDVKPSNIMVSVEGEVKVLDFGTARSTSAFRSAQTGAIRMGSLKYMSPERRDGDRGGHPGDVYALGLTLVELLLGRWLDLLPLDPEEHDAEVVEVINGLSDLGMPNQQWDLSLRQFLVRMLASNAEYRPGAEEAARTLRAFVEQGKGPMLDTFAVDVIAPLTQAVRGNFQGGALAGRRVSVHVDGSGPQGQGSNLGASGPQGKAETPRPRVEPPRPTPTAPPRVAPEAARLPETGRLASRPAEARPPEIRSEPARPPVGPRPEAVRQPTTPRPEAVRLPTGPRPEQVQPPETRIDLPRVETRPPEPPRKEPLRERKVVMEVPDEGGGGGFSVWLIVAGVILVGGAVVMLVMVLAGGLMFGKKTDEKPVVPTPPPVVVQPPPTPPPPTEPTAPVAVTATGATLQWIHLDKADGSSVAKSNGPLNGAAPAGDYKLSVKFVGRPALSATVQVTASGLTLDCSLQKDGTLSCGTGKAKVVLTGG